MATIAIDYETFWRKNGAPSVKKQGNWRYTHDPEFEVLMVAVTDGKDAWCGPVKEFNFEALRGHTKISHNAGFELAVTAKLVEDGLAPSGLDTDWHCSADLCAWAGNRRALKDGVEYWLGEKMSKEARDELADHTFEQLFAKKKLWADTVKYAHLDAVRCLRLWEKLSPSWPTIERRLSDLTIEQNTRGVAIDQNRLEADISMLEEALWRNEKAMPWIAEGSKPESYTALHKMCRKAGIPCPPVKKHDEEGAIIWEYTYQPKFDWARRFGEHKSITKLLASHRTVLDRIRPDGRFDFALKYCGAHTRRWAGAAGFNMQNMRAKPMTLNRDTGHIIAPKEYAQLKKTGQVPDSWYAVDQRALFVPAPGKQMLSVDLAQIEPRVLNWVVGNRALLDRVEAGESVYEAYARTTKGLKGDYLWSGGEVLKDAAPALYKAIKIQVLQLGYGSGWKKFLSQALENEVELDEAGAKQVVDEYRAANEGIVKLWGTLDQAYKRAGNSPERRFVLELPNGQRLQYEQIRRTLKKITVDPETGVTTKEYGLSAMTDAYRRRHFYGGMLVENLIQAISRDVMAEGMLRLEDAGMRTLWSVHDEVIVEGTNLDTREAERLMSINPAWLPRCPLGAEAKVLRHYEK